MGEVVGTVIRLCALNRIKVEARGFDYIAPAGQDPLKAQDTPQELQRRVR